MSLSVFTFENLKLQVKHTERTNVSRGYQSSLWWQLILAHTYFGPDVRTVNGTGMIGTDTVFRMLWESLSAKKKFACWCNDSLQTGCCLPRPVNRSVWPCEQLSIGRDTICCNPAKIKLNKWLNVLWLFSTLFSPKDPEALCATSGHPPTHAHVHIISIDS